MILELAITHASGKINWNFDELKTQLEVELEKYDNLVVNVEDIKQFKETRAKLNGIITTIDNKRKDVKKEYSLPLTKFEEEVKNLTRMINDVNSKIDTQIKKFEEEERRVKKQRLEDYFIAISAELPININLFFEDRWLNKSISENKCMEEIKNKFDKIIADFNLIDDLAIEDKKTMKAFFLESFDLTNAKRKYQAIEEQKKQVEEHAEVKKQTAIRALEEAKPVIAKTEPDNYLGHFQAIATLKQLEALVNFCKLNNIKLIEIESIRKVN